MGNASYSAQNAVVNFQMDTSGFTSSKDGDVTADFGNGDVYLFAGDSMTLTIRVNDNPLLKELASSGHARVDFGWSKLVTVEEGGSWGGIEKNHQKTRADLKINGNTRISDSSTTSSAGSKSGSSSLQVGDVITISIEGFAESTDGPSGVRGLYVRFSDATRPVLSGYSFTGDGAERMNANTGQMELYVKENEYIDLTYKFSEPIRPSTLVPTFSDHFLRHPLFVNPDGTGLPAAGQQQYMMNMTYTSSTLKDMKNKISYRYSGVKYHNSGNLPLAPKMMGTSGAINPIDLTLEEKLKQAQLADAAGNVAFIDLTHTADNTSNAYLRGNAVNPFDYDNSGYRIIVDAVAPKYTKTGNGIQPEILTGVVLNKNDSITFTLQFTEEVVVKRGWNLAQTYLLFSNGMKAYYEQGEGTKTWTFTIGLNEAKSLETPLLKAIALTHDNKGTDTNVLQDYAGNMLIQPANHDGVHQDGDESLLNSKIDWADLSIDQTPPDIAFRFEQGGATASQYEKNGRVTIDATDPNLLVPPLDPVNTGMLRPSKGVYRPSNMTGDQSPAVGLVYYYWSQDGNEPFAGKVGDRFAAIKRYALAAKQPREELYPGEFNLLNLSVVNNKTNLLSPPDEARLPENSGPWYLHAWTADMSWDSARELMQYEKMKSFVQENPAQYAAWKAELPNEASEQDREFHAETKALAAVGQYGDLSLWGLNDFKQDDSNWSYNVTPFLLDNEKPNVVFVGAQNDGTKEVLVSVALTDAHAGVDTAYYQFAAQGEELYEEDWKAINLTNGRAVVSTLGNVFEDGVYTLHVKASDYAGNNVITEMAGKVTVDSTSLVTTSFYPDADAGYAKGHDITFQINGTTLKNNEMAYAITASSVRPANEEAYTKLTGTTVAGGGMQFVIPKDTSKNGIQYVHIVAEPQDESRLYTYVKAYYFDNAAPEITFNRNGSSYPGESQEVTASINEPYSANGLMSKYQWVRDGEAVPEASSGSWLPWPQDGKVSITNEWLADGETADYRLYVYAVDGAGNETMAATDTFRVSKSDTPGPPSSGESNLLYVYNSGGGSFTAIIKLDLDTVDKRGYDYSLSPDGGTSWSRWRSYANFVSLEVPSDDPQLLNMMVKFRKSGGVASAPIALQTDEVSSSEPVYALSSFHTTKDVQSATGVDLQITPGLAVRVIPGDENPVIPERIGNSNTFKIRENGYYSFLLTDMTDETRTDTLYVVVSNIDDTPPTGEAVLLHTQPTNQSVSAKLINTSEPVRILNNEGRNTYTFEENGQFTFEFADEAGNIGTATATVSTIDKEAPDVRIVRSYQYGEDADAVFGTIRNHSGEVVAASGVVLRVEKASPDAKDFFTITGEESAVLRENGEVSFVVSDAFGNTTKVSEVVSHISSAPPQPEMITYTFVDDEGNPISEIERVTINGQTYAKGKLQVTLSGQTTPGNAVFQGMMPVEQQGGGYENQISDNDGNYQLTRTFDRNGSFRIALTDLLGNRTRLPIKVEGLDNTAPELYLNRSVTAIPKGKADFDFRRDLGGYRVLDNVSSPENIEVEIAGLNLNVTGRQQVTYIMTDEVGNQASVTQEVLVLDHDGMLVFANGQFISSALGESGLFNTNHLTFEIDGYNSMVIDGVQRTNEAGTYDILYYSGLFREGQMKYIAHELTYEELVNGNFTVIFPQAGWYTIIVRNQEREREYSTLFITKTE
ncbi:Ig-like domain repeat protein [Paenibacillus chungangensis]|uniref:Ig-like domain repeat protein n=1 Tax=Paenibacillus chungangensis TaxID=696535 RepID=A0ABW3HP26_9BACL